MLYYNRNIIPQKDKTQKNTNSLKRKINLMTQSNYFMKIPTTTLPSIII